jgi:spore germination protein YaaH
MSAPAPDTTSPLRRGRLGRPRAGFTAFALTAIAGLAVAAGVALTDGEWERSGPPIQVASWAPYWQPDIALASFQANARLFSDVSIVAFSTQDGRTISAYPQLAADALTRFRDATGGAGVKLIATIFDESPAGAVAAVLADPVARAAHVQAIVDIVDGDAFDGVDLDYENFAFVDGRDTWATTRPNWIAFLGELAAALDPLDKLLIVSVPPVYDGGQTDASGYWVYDYASMGAIVDRIRVMAYDFNVAGGQPGPIAPIDWVQRLVDAITDLVPPEKVDLGIPMYGYDWFESVAGICPVEQQPENRAMSTVRAARTIAERGLTPTWDPTTSEYSFAYVDTLNGADAAGAPVTCSVNRRVHYLDATAIHRRAWIAHRSDLHGVVLWALGNDDPLTWEGLSAARRGEQFWNDPLLAGTVPAGTVPAGT